MVNKYCVIVTSSPYYILGANAILNALEYYKHTDIDFVLMHTKPMIPYLNLIKDRFSFPIIGQLVDNWDDDTMLDWRGEIYEDMSCTWAEFHYLSTIKDKYEAVCMLDADLLLTGSIMPYLKIAAQTDLLLIPHNVRSGVWIADYPYAKTPWDMIYGHVVEHWITFFGTKSHTDLMKFVWDNRFNNVDLPKEKHVPQEELFLFNRGLYELGKLDQVFELPGRIWMTADVENGASIRLKATGDFGIVNTGGDKVYGIHSRGWNKNIIKHTLELTNEKVNPEKCAHLKNNARTVEEAVRFFNCEGKVTLEDIRAIGKDYVDQLDSFEKITY